MNDARSSILKRLRQSKVNKHSLPQNIAQWTAEETEDLQKKFSRLLRAVHAEVIDLKGSSWIEWVNKELPRRGLVRILVGDNENGNELAKQADKSLRVQTYTAPVEEWKQELFNDIEVGITGAQGAIAATGTLILCPDAGEPRLMSLVPPVHIALVDPEKIYRNLSEAINDNGWSSAMPTNLLLISGPSKTADIEQTLTYGIHGPQQLIVLIK